MNISSLFNFSTFGSKNQPRAATQALDDPSPLAQAVRRADQRVQAEVTSNTTQMSSFGQLKSMVSQVQQAARKLSDLPTPIAADESSTAVNQLLAALNAAITMANATATLPGATEASQNAQRVAGDLQGMVSEGAPLANSLKTIGVGLQGSEYKLDAAQFGAALGKDADGVQATLVKFGQHLDQMASAELAVNGDVAGSLSLLKRQATTLQAQQSALESAAQATSAYAGKRGQAASYGVGAYQANMG